MASAEVRLFTAGLPSVDDWPKWYYQDLTGDLQGPFDAQTMIRWYQEQQLPLDLKCAGIYPQDSSTAPTNLSHFQRLQTLMENSEAGLQYMPLRVTKGITEEGPATPTKGGTRASAGPVGNHLLTQQPGSISAVLAQQLAAAGGPAAVAAGGQFSQDSRPDVTHALDQRTAAGMMQLTQQQLTQQQLHMQGQGLLQQLHAQQQQQQRGPLQQRGAPASRQLLQQQQQPGRAPGAGRHAGAVASFHELQLQQPGMPAAAAASAPAGPAAAGEALTAADSDVQPGSETWSAALTKLLSREGFSGKDADIKWRVILASGDRVGPFSCDQLTDWLLRGSAPKGINKQQAGQAASNPGALQLCGILSADYNAQRLPGMKFFKPLSQLVPAVAAGLAYEAVNKHDLQRGLPKPLWNEAPGPGGSMPAAAAAAAPLPGQQPGAKGGLQQAGKAGKAARAASAGSSGKGGAAARGQQQQQANRPRSGSAAGMAAATAAAGLDGPVPANDKGGFKHPMALRQQQRQQQQEDALSAAAAAAHEALGGGPRPQQQGRGLSPGGVGAQAGKGSDKVSAQGPGFGSRPNSFGSGSASRGILMAANSMGGAAAAAAAAAQQQQLQQPGAANAAHVAAIAAAAGQLGPGLAQLRQQQAAQQVQMQMQGLAVGTPAAAAFLQGAQGMPHGMWLGKPQQGQLPGQSVAGMFAAQQSVLGYQMQAGYAALASQAAGAASADEPLVNGQLPRTSSSSGSAALQAADGKASRVSTASSQGPYAGYQQQQAAANGAVQVAEQQQPLTPAMMQAAALLFLHMEQQQQQQPGGSQVRWWVQRSERAYSGPFSGMQMYQSYLQPVPHMRFTDGTLIAAMSGGTGGRDVPPSRAFVPLSALLEAATHGYGLLPMPAKDAAQQGPNSPPPQVRHFTSGTIAPLQQVLQAPLQQYYQQRQQLRQSMDGGELAGKQQQQRAGMMHGASPSSQQGGAAVMAAANRMANGGVPPSPSKSRAQQQQQQQQQMLQMMQQQQQQPGMQAAGGSIQFMQRPDGSLVAVQAGGAGMHAMPGAAAMIPAAAAGMGGLGAPQGMQGMPMLAAQGLPSADPLAVASALFTAGNTPPPMAPVWYLLSPGAEPHTAPKTQGPYEPTDMLAMFKEGRLGPASLVCATHRAAQGQQQAPPPPNAFQPLQALLATTSSDMLCHQLSAATAMGGHMGQLLPAAAMMQGGQMGHMGQVPMLIQVPVSGGQGGAAMLAMPAGLQLQMQQLQQMQMQVMPQGAGVAVNPAFAQQQGGLVLQQQQQQQMAPAVAAAPAAASAQQQQGPDGRSSSVSSAAAPGPQQQAQRSGAVPTRVDTWGSLDAHEKLSAVAGSSTQQQQQLQQLGQHMSAGAQAVEAALATSRRASSDSHFSHAGPHSSSSGMMGMGALWMQPQQQQQQHSGPRSSSGGSGSFAQFAPQPQQQQQQQQQQLMHHQLMVRRTSSGSSRSNPASGPASTGGEAAAAAAAVAAALAHAGAASAGMAMPLASAPAAAFGVQMQYGAAPHPAQQQQQQQQLHSAMLAGMAQAAGMAGIPEHQQQPLPEPTAAASPPPAEVATAGEAAAAAGPEASEGSPASASFQA